MVVSRRTELQDLVDNPNETLEVEYKEWLDLVDSPEARADLARHIGALANYGGGAIVFGFTDTMRSAGANCFSKVAYNRDLVAGIVKRYLEPSFQCDVVTVRAANGNDYPIIVVPPHGATPICAKASGPTVDGKPRGIVQGVHYIRKPGPESAPILTAAEWAPIIRRCAMHDRAAILGAIDAALRGAAAATTATADALKTWHDAAHTVFVKDAAGQTLPPELDKRHFQFSYAIERSDGQQLNPNELLEILRQVNGEARDLVNTGWSMFHIPYLPEAQPVFATDAASGQGEQDFLECALLRLEDRVEHATDLWRVSPDGKATLVRSYFEDLSDFGLRGLKPGSWLSPNWMVRDLAEVVRHARGLAERFDSPTAVSFRCEWHGLAGRIVHDPMGLWRPGSPPARDDHRIATGNWPISALVNGWPQIVAHLGAPVARLLNVGHILMPEWVKGQAPKWQH